MTPEAGKRQMSESGKQVEVETISLSEVAGDLQQSRLFAETPVEDLFGVDQVERVKAKAGTILVQPGDARLSYWLVLSGNVHAERTEPDG